MQVGFWFVHFPTNMGWTAVVISLSNSIARRLSYKHFFLNLRIGQETPPRLTSRFSNEQQKNTYAKRVFSGLEVFASFQFCFVHQLQTAENTIFCATSVYAPWKRAHLITTVVLSNLSKAIPLRTWQRVWMHKSFAECKQTLNLGNIYGTIWVFAGQKRYTISRVK